MTSTAFARPAVSVDELKRAWGAVQAGQFGRARKPVAAVVPSVPRDSRPAVWAPAAGEHVVPVLGVVGSAGLSTVALALALAAQRPARVVECGPAIASGLASASTAELGIHNTGWRQGKRDAVLIERTSEFIAGSGDVPLPVPAAREDQLTILDVGWEASGVIYGTGWLTTAIAVAPAVVMVSPATVPAFRRLDALLELFAAVWPGSCERLCLAVVGPRRKKWPRGLEHSAGPVTRRLLDTDRVVEIPRDRDLATAGLDSRPLPDAVLAATAQLLPLVDLAGSPLRATAEGAEETESARAGHTEGNLAWNH